MQQRTQKVALGELSTPLLLTVSAEERLRMGGHALGEFC